MPRTPEWADTPEAADGWADDLDREQDERADRRREALDDQEVRRW